MGLQAIFLLLLGLGTSSLALGANPLICPPLYATIEPFLEPTAAEFSAAIETLVSDLPDDFVKGVLGKKRFAIKEQGYFGPDGPNTKQFREWLPEEIGFSRTRPSTPRLLQYRGDSTSDPDTALTLFKGSLFVDNYFRNNGRATRGQSSMLAVHQPWLEWNGSAKKFELRQSGAGIAILKRLKPSPEGTFVFYRGLRSNQEKVFFDGLGQLYGKTSLQEPERIELQKRLYQTIEEWKGGFKGTERYETAAPPSRGDLGKLKALESELSAENWNHQEQVSLADRLTVLVAEIYKKMGRDGFFLTDDLSSAETWSRRGWPKGKPGGVVQVNVSGQDLARMVSSGEIYLGIEGTVEAAFISPDAQALMFRASSGMK
ncbi:MAG: hypothetical protein ACXWQO_16605 [Bdellovibrionota bacterium]